MRSVSVTTHFCSLMRKLVDELLLLATKILGKWEKRKHGEKPKENASPGQPVRFHSMTRCSPARGKRWRTAMLRTSYTPRHVSMWTRFTQKVQNAHGPGS